MPSLSAIPASHTSVGRYRPAVIVTPSAPSTGDGPVEDQAPALGPDRRGGRDHVDLARLLIAQQRHEVVDGGVPRGQASPETAVMRNPFHEGNPRPGGGVPPGGHGRAPLRRAEAPHRRLPAGCATARAAHPDRDGRSRRPSLHRRHAGAMAGKLAIGTGNQGGETQNMSPLRRLASSARWFATSSAYRSTIARDFHPLSRIRSPSDPPDFSQASLKVCRN